MIKSAVRAAVISRAGNRCEYCHLPQDHYESTFHLDHVIASQHTRNDDDLNLALACPQCNRKKGPNLSAIDPISRSIVELFNPRQQTWTEHFRWIGTLIVGITGAGRATVALLELNDAERLDLRRALLVDGNFPAGGW